jgi:hypothetical protein
MTTTSVVRIVGIVARREALAKNFQVRSFVNARGQRPAVTLAEQNACSNPIGGLL